MRRSHLGQQNGYLNRNQSATVQMLVTGQAGASLDVFITSLLKRGLTLYQRTKSP
jgi:hypothetical protein